ncbi:hypothetical protein RB2501_02730 [Robiginitalea biformata HTCC2501]|uniref:Uncharacterized protein n=1 Tax=Robiginitalea biformata (strain ATCC BAA-864 / DSM 15991 / KCTC 12146 / HTCC2501) TaxID=313596 RepID=A4CPI3_ROBBH|nr:hypothetical protein RB2501_02730 [Robiginitalea biformata HTCC2501]
MAEIAVVAEIAAAVETDGAEIAGAEIGAAIDPQTSI